MSGITIDFGYDENGQPEIISEIKEINRVAKKREKGKSIIEFPKDFVVVDIETTGFDPEFDEIIEISALRIRNDLVTDKFETLVKPKQEIDDFITDLTGITNEMVSDAPNITYAIRQFKDFLSNDIILGYNVSFDVNFLYDNLLSATGEYLQNDYIDAMRIARKALPELEHHRQVDIADYFKINNKKAHRAGNDTLVCLNIFQQLQTYIHTKGINLEDFIGSFNRSQLKAKDITTEKTSFDETHPLFKKNCVFTGTLAEMSRSTAMKIVANFGGIPCDSVNKKTNFLILGKQDYRRVKGEKSTKQRKAEELIKKGTDLQIISEQVFYDMVNDN